jgi:hypothetical protein
MMMETPQMDHLDESDNDSHRRASPPPPHPYLLLLWDEGGTCDSLAHRVAFATQPLGRPPLKYPLAAQQVPLGRQSSVAHTTGFS